MVNVEKVSKFLKEWFDDADKVEYHNVAGGYWDVIYYDGDDVRVEAYKFVDGKLKNFSSMVYGEDMYEEE